MALTQLNAARIAGALATALQRPERPLIQLMRDFVFYSQHGTESFVGCASFDWKRMRIAGVQQLARWIIDGRTRVAWKVFVVIVRHLQMIQTFVIVARRAAQFAQGFQDAGRRATTRVDQWFAFGQRNQQNHWFRNEYLIFGWVWLVSFRLVLSTVYVLRNAEYTQSKQNWKKKRKTVKFKMYIYHKK